MRSNELIWQLRFCGGQRSTAVCFSLNSHKKKEKRGSAGLSVTIHTGHPVGCDVRLGSSLRIAYKSCSFLRSLFNSSSLKNKDRALVHSDEEYESIVRTRLY